MLRRVAHGPFLHLCTSRRNADDHLDVRLEERLARAVYLFDESPDHHLGSVEVRNYSVLQRPYRLDFRVFLSLHRFRLLSQCNGFPGHDVDCHYARFVQNNLVVLEYDGVRRSEVNREFLSQE